VPVWVFKVIFLFQFCVQLISEPKKLLLYKNGFNLEKNFFDFYKAGGTTPRSSPFIFINRKREKRELEKNGKAGKKSGKRKTGNFSNWFNFTKKNYSSTIATIAFMVQNQNFCQ
jgi:hypothetical protein